MAKRIAGQLFGEFFDKIGALGSRTDKAHIALDYVYQLRQLIDKVIAQKLARFGNARCVVHPVGVARAIGHGAEFVYLKDLTVFSNSILAENGWAAGIELYCDGYDEHNGPQQQKRC